MITSLKVGQTVLVHSNPKDAAGNGPAPIKPGEFGNTGTQWLPQTSGVVSFVVSGPEGADATFTALTVGSTVVNILASTLAGVPKQTPFTINVTVGDLDHFDPIADPPQG